MSSAVVIGPQLVESHFHNYYPLKEPHLLPSLSIHLVVAALR